MRLYEIVNKLKQLEQVQEIKKLRQVIIQGINPDGSEGDQVIISLV